MSNECEIFLVWCSFFTFTPDFCTTRLDSGKKIITLQNLIKLVAECYIMFHEIFAINNTSHFWES